jgi:hypothetical protein
MNKKIYEIINCKLKVIKVNQILKWEVDLFL